MELVPFEFLAVRPSASEPAVHERQQVASKPALIRMAHEDLLRIVGVDGNLTSAGVIAAATKRAIEANFIAAAVGVECHATFGCRFCERRFRLKLIDVHISSPCQSDGWEEGNDATLVSDA